MRGRTLLATLVLALGSTSCGRSLNAPGYPSLPNVYDHSFAVVVGINQYTNFPALKAASDDAKEVSAVLESQGFQVVCGKDCTGPILNQNATKEKLEDVISRTLPSMLGPGDRVVVYFAGHGVSEDEDGAATGYLLPADAEQNKITSTGLSMRDIQVWLEAYRAKHVMLVADACYSGLALSTRSVALSPATVDYARIVAERKVRFTLVAGRDDQEASEADGHGIFTSFWLRGLAGEADGNQDGLITSDELATFVTPRVQGFVAKNMNREQTPQYARSGQGEVVFAVGNGVPKSKREASPSDGMKAPPQPPAYPPVLSAVERKASWLHVDQLSEPDTEQSEESRLEIGQTLYELGYPLSAESQALATPFTNPTIRSNALRLKGEVARQMSEGTFIFSDYSIDELMTLRAEARELAVYQRLRWNYDHGEFAQVTANARRIDPASYYGGRAAYLEGLAWISLKRSVPAIKAFRRSAELAKRWRTPGDVAGLASLAIARTLYSGAFKIDPETNSPMLANAKTGIFAMNEFARIRPESSWYPQAREGLLWSQMFLTQEDSALQTASWLWSRFPSPSSARGKVVEAMILYYRKDYRAALRAISVAVSRFPHPISHPILSPSEASVRAMDEASLCHIDPPSCLRGVFPEGYNSLEHITPRLKKDTDAFAFAERLLSGAEQSPPLDSFQVGFLSELRLNQDLARMIAAVHDVRRERAQFSGEALGVRSLRVAQAVGNALEKLEASRLVAAAKLTRAEFDYASRQADRLLHDFGALIIDIQVAQRNLDN